MLLKPLQIDSVWWERRVYSEISSAVERFSYTEDVTGSNPVFRTMAIDVIELVVDEVSKYKTIDGISIYVQAYPDRKIVVYFEYSWMPAGCTRVRYEETIPDRWFSLSESFLKKEISTTVRYLIKKAMSQELEMLFVYEGKRFNPL